MNIIHRLTEVQTFKPSGILVYVNGHPHTVYPETTVVEKKGTGKQFWFTHRNKKIQATQSNTGTWSARF